MAKRRKPVSPLRAALEVFLVALGAAMIVGIGATWRIRYSGLEHLREARSRRRPLLLAALHGRMQALPFLFSRPGLAPMMVMISGSRDGHLISRIVKKIGLDVVTGSTGKDGARGFIDTIRQLRAQPDRPVGLLVDGGRGPRGHCKPGAIQLAQRSGEMVIPLIASADRCWQLHRVWDRCRIPKPFARVHLAFMPIISVPKKTSPTQAEIIRQQVEQSLLRGTEILDRRFRFVDPHPLQEEVKAPS